MSGSKDANFGRALATGGTGRAFLATDRVHGSGEYIDYEDAFFGNTSGRVNRKELGFADV